MFLEKIELRSTIYQYQLEQITEDDDSIIDMGIEAAIIEVKSCLTPSNKKEWDDGRVKYDAEAIFAATGTSRNALILELTKTVAEWWIIRLCNADILFEQVKVRYERAVDYLNKVAKGDRTISSLPTLPVPVDGDGNPLTALPFRMGGRKKFTHE
jgi:hypothetical protein